MSLGDSDFSASSLAALVAFLLLPLVLPGCDRPGTPTSQESVRRHVLSTVYPLADVVRQVAGKSVEVEWFCEAGQDPRDLKLTDEQVKRARAADLIVNSGFFDPWAGEMMDLRQQALRLIRVDEMPAAIDPLVQDDDFPRGALWLDPAIVKEVADAVRQRLTILDARRDRELRASCDAFTTEVDALDADLRARLAPLKGRKFLSLRPTWGQFARRYGLGEVAPLNTEPRNLTDEEVRTLKAAANREHTDLLAIDATLLPGVQRELQLRTGLRLLPLDPLGSSAPDGNSTWIKLMRYNLQQLERGLK
jgi:ABC-type Zn uptake system ZnuABC Zn-binding protein ZnuA